MWLVDYELFIIIPKLFVWMSYNTRSGALKSRVCLHSYIDDITCFHAVSLVWIQSNWRTVLNRNTLNATLHHNDMYVFVCVCIHVSIWVISCPYWDLFADISISLTDNSQWQTNVTLLAYMVSIMYLDSSSLHVLFTQRTNNSERQNNKSYDYVYERTWSSTYETCLHNCQITLTDTALTQWSL